MREPVAGALIVVVLATFGCSQPQPAPLSTVVVPPEALSDLATAVAVVGTQSALMREAISTLEPAATITPTPTAEEAPETDGLNLLGSASPPSPAMRPPASSAADAAPCAVQQVKGNLNSMIYHVPGGGSYARTKANVVCFATEAQATAAGYRKARN